MAGTRRGAVIYSQNENANRTIVTGEPPTDRTIYTCLALFSIMVLSLMLGSRFSRLRRNALNRRNITSMLVIALYVLVLIFIFCSAVMLAGQGVYTYNLCFAATWICLILYTACKLIIYVFLVERVHVVRAPFTRRSRDWLYLAGMIIVLASFAGVAINAYLSPIISISPSDGRCHMGIPGKASIPFMAVDIAVDAALTGIFFYLLKPVVRLHGLSNLPTLFGRSQSVPSHSPGKDETPVQRNIRVLLWKSLIGSMLIMLPTIANMIQFYITQGRELGMVCLTVCTMDVAWDTVVIHWLTFGSAEAEKNLTRSMESLRRSPGGATPEQRNSVAGINQNVATQLRSDSLTALPIPDKAWTVNERKPSGDSTSPLSAFKCGG